MSYLERPKLRPLSAVRVDHQGRSYVALEDSLGLFSGQVLIPLPAFLEVVRYFDGHLTLDAICERAQADSGFVISMVELENLVDRLDRSMVLEGPTYLAFATEYADQEVRLPSHAGRSYPIDPVRLSDELDCYYEGPRGAGSPSRSDPRPRSLRAVISPHIDFGRGGATYTHAYKSLVEESDADVFVILGVAHQACRHRFALTRKDFRTPLGLARTDREFVDRVAELAGPHLFDDELAHRTEHSIEFQVVFLQHALGGDRDFSIVPILVGSFHDLMKSGVDPVSDPEVGGMIEALRSIEASSGKKVAYIGGIDLCHVGQEFGDPLPVDDPTLQTVRSFDSEMLARAAALDPAGWFSTASQVENRWRVCGLAATYTLLHAIAPAEGRVLCYDQAVNVSRSCCVSFASVVFDAN